MRIGEVAVQAGVSAKTVRHYESLGLVRSARLANGYRDYPDGSARLIAEARFLSGLGIRLERTAPFLQCLADGNANSDDCPDSVEAYRLAVRDLDGRIDELTARRDAIAALLASADDRAPVRCEFSDPVQADGAALTQETSTRAAEARRGAGAASETTERKQHHGSK